MSCGIPNVQRVCADSDLCMQLDCPTLCPAVPSAMFSAGLQQP